MSGVGSTSKSVAISNRTLLMGMSVLLLAPTSLVATRFEILPATAILAGCFGAFALVQRDHSLKPYSLLKQDANLWLLGLCIAAAAAILFYSGSMHFFHPTLDWRIRDAVLADLSVSGFPATYRLGQNDYLLRAPLAMYIMPSIFGHYSSIFGAHVALWVQNSIAFGVILYFFCIVGRGARHAALIMGSGTCAVLSIAILLARGETLESDRIVTFGMDAWHPIYQYSSSLIQVFWVPNHAIPGWWIALAFLLYLDQELDIASVAATASSAFFWSPLVVFAVPFLLLGGLWTNLGQPRIWLAGLVACCFAPLFLYFLADASDIPLSTVATNPQSVGSYLVFVLGLAPQAAFLILNRRLLPDRYLGALWVSLLLLVGLPGLTFGTSNDLVMRGSIIPLALVWFMFGYILFALRVSQWRQKCIGTIIAFLCSLSAIGTLMTHHLLPGWPISDCSIVQSARELGAGELSPHYHAQWAAIPNWLMTRNSGAPRPTEPRECWSVNN